MALVAEAGERCDIEQRAPAVVQQRGGALQPAFAQVFARRSAIAPAERAR
jgi:hypothetical protein